MSANNGGPAFPGEADIVYSNDENSVIKTVPVKYTGMTLRDYFAAGAMSQGMAVLVALGNRPNDHQLCSLAETAYKAADAMLAEREKGGAQ